MRENDKRNTADLTMKHETKTQGNRKQSDTGAQSQEEVLREDHGRVRGREELGDRGKRWGSGAGKSWGWAG